MLIKLTWTCKCYMSCSAKVYDLVMGKRKCLIIDYNRLVHLYVEDCFEELPCQQSYAIKNQLGLWSAKYLHWGVFKHSAPVRWPPTWTPFSILWTQPSIHLGTHLCPPWTQISTPYQHIGGQTSWNTISERERGGKVKGGGGLLPSKKSCCGGWVVWRGLPRAMRIGTMSLLPVIFQLSKSSWSVRVSTHFTTSSLTAAWARVSPSAVLYRQSYTNDKVDRINLTLTF